MGKWVLLPAALISLGGCTLYIDNAIKKYNVAADQVELGDSKEVVLAVLLPTQKDLPQAYKKNPEKYMKEDVRVEIYYMRSARQPDGLTTDDEFVPYVFNDAVLVGIGWNALGGPKTQGQAKPETHVHTTTIIY